MVWRWWTTKFTNRSPGGVLQDGDQTAQTHPEIRSQALVVAQYGHRSAGLGV